jgi:hypothetical protein
MNYAPSLAELKRICRKGERDPFWVSNIFWRPFSIYVTWLAIRLRLGAPTITTISAVFAILSSLVLLDLTPRGLVLSVIFMQAFLLLDHVDGEVARYMSTGKPASSLRDFSGSYYDRLVHYFQGPSFYFCLGAGLWMTDHGLHWLMLGLLGTIGSSGFPRFVASYELLQIILRHRAAETLDFVREASEYYSVYWKGGAAPREFYLVPRSAGELVYAAKQFMGFPGHMFVYAVAVIVTVWSASFIWIKLYLVFYGVLLGANTLYATVRFLVVLSRVPIGDGDAGGPV